jgi:hypothetical protein
VEIVFNQLNCSGCDIASSNLPTLRVSGTDPVIASANTSSPSCTVLSFHSVRDAIYTESKAEATSVSMRETCFSGPEIA